MSVLVTYSSNNKIKIVSEFIANRIDADSIEIKDLKRKNGFFNNIRNNYNALCLNKTEISPEVIDFTNYNLILLGTPSTYGNPSPAILTLIDNCNFKNKDVIIYTTTNIILLIYLMLHSTHHVLHHTLIQQHIYIHFHLLNQ